MVADKWEEFVENARRHIWLARQHPLQSDMALCLIRLESCLDHLQKLYDVGYEDRGDLPRLTPDVTVFKPVQYHTTSGPWSGENISK